MQFANAQGKQMARNVPGLMRGGERRNRTNQGMRERAACRLLAVGRQLHIANECRRKCICILRIAEVENTHTHTHAERERRECEGDRQTCAW